ncbi:hypothetical protein ACH42_00150 [Endozoicomonas sp. (ex Bugula neritina AB1)]|nr:hypothetical protein ACH42_00150 [Endozoicomonas sp. (ex Bugula neritina AB1)]
MMIVCMRLITAPLQGCLLVAAVIVGKKYFPYWSSVSFLENSLLFLAGMIAGVRLPDLDLVLPGFSHRSGITHSCLVPVLCWQFFLLPVAGGLALGMALHMASDVQPKAWTGGAIIKFPFLGGIGLLSPVWLIASVVGCVAILLEALSNSTLADRQLMLLTSLFFSGWYFVREEKKPLLPLMTMAFSLLLIHAVRDGSISMQEAWSYFFQ